MIRNYVGVSYRSYGSGGNATCGGTIPEAGLYPNRFRRQSAQIRLTAPPIPEPPIRRSHPGDQFRGSIDPGALLPGEMHQLSGVVTPTPQSILDGSYVRSQSERDIVIYAPRRPEHMHPPYIPSVLFKVDGKVGPYIKDVMRGRVHLDSSSDKVFEYHAWKQTHWVIDWPGIRNPRELMPCYKENGEPICLGEIAMIICTGLCAFFMNGKKGRASRLPQELNDATREWNLRDIDYRDVRIIGINYYKAAWVPILAFDAEYEPAQGMSM